MINTKETFINCHDEKVAFNINKKTISIDIVYWSPQIGNALS
jgi:hypothetical protein